MDYIYPDYLCHYGVQGMKWGQHLMAKYELNQAGRALKRSITNKSGSKKSNRAKEILNLYEGKYSRKQIANAATKSANRAKKVQNVLGDIATAFNVVGGTYNAASLGLAALVGPHTAAVYGITMSALAHTSAYMVGSQALINLNQRNVNTSYKHVQNEINKYRNSVK